MGAFNRPIRAYNGSVGLYWSIGSFKASTVSVAVSTVSVAASTVPVAVFNWSVEASTGSGGASSETGSVGPFITGLVFRHELLRSQYAFRLSSRKNLYLVRWSYY